jgi:sec-independent protein translocase protein TatA
MGANLLTPTHLILLVVACLLLFGAKRLPEVGRSLGSGIREFKTTVTGIDAPADSSDLAESTPPSPPA